MARYFIKLSYCGSAYHGWQSQPGEHEATVQGVLSDAFSKYLRQEVELTGCGRTDTGVHARDYVAHFDSLVLEDIPTLIHRLNRMLPPDIAVHDVFRVRDEAHARFDASSRSYEYFLHTEKSPFTQHSFYYTYNKPKLEILNTAAVLLLQYTDFYPFCKSHTDVQTTLCKLSSCEWQQEGSRYIFRISSDRFLRGMIRLIVGMCLNVDRGRLDIGEVAEALTLRKRLRTDWSVPPQGLFLYDIRYPGHIFNM